MTQQGDDPAEHIERSTQQLEQDLDRLEHHIDDAKDRLKERQADAERLERGEDVAGDWEDKKPDRPGGDDAAD
jgi:peptidoglycan hydrolase CwlO-like protein